MNRRSLLTLLASTALAGCNGATQAQREADVTAPSGNWTQFRGGPRRRGHATRTLSFEQETEISETEHESVVAPVLDGNTAILPTDSSLVGLNLEGLTVEYEIDIESVPTLPPARCSSVVAVATADGVAGYDVESRSQVWSLSARGTHTASSAPAALGGHFVIQDGNRVRLVEHESGTVVWRREFDARVEGFAASEESVVVNRNRGDESVVVALDSATGKTEWSVTVESSSLHPVVGRSRQGGSPFVFALSEYGRLVAIEDGTVQWSVETGLGDPDSLAVAEGVVVVVSEPSDGVAGVAVDDGSLAWQSRLEFGESVVATGDRAFVSDANAGIVELNVTTGARERTFGNARFGGSLVPTSREMLYVHGSSDRVCLLRDV